MIAAMIVASIYLNGQVQMAYTTASRMISFSSLSGGVEDPPAA